MYEYNDDFIVNDEFEIEVDVTSSFIVRQKLVFLDDSVKIYVNGILVIQTQQRQEITYTLPSGLVLIQIILINNAGNDVGLVLAGDFIDNDNVKFA